MAARWVASARPFRPASSSAGRQTTDGTCLAQPEGPRGAHAQPRGVRGQDDACACSPVDPGQLGRACPLEQARPAPRGQPTPAAPAASCAASAQYSSRYNDYDVYVHSNQPDQTVTVSAPDGTSKTWHPDSSGYADVYFYDGRSASGEQITVRVGAATCQCSPDPLLDALRRLTTPNEKPALAELFFQYRYRDSNPGFRRERAAS